MTRVVPDQLFDDIADAGVTGLWVTPSEIGNIPHLKGAYVLAVYLESTIQIDFLPTGLSQLIPGWYAYVGSAWGSGGIRARVKRHFQQNKTAHWHIDRLTMKSAKTAALAVAEGYECEIVSKLLSSHRFKVAIAGFGSSDCHVCESHLLAGTSS